MSRNLGFFKLRIKVMKGTERSALFQSKFIERLSDRTIISISMLLLICVALPFIGNAYWDDEIFSIITSHSWSAMFRTFREYENNMSLYFAMLHIWMIFFGDSEIATHSLSLLFAILTIPFFYKLERIWLDKSTSFAGLLLLVANPIFSFYAIESRSYSLFVLFGTISTLLFIRLVCKPGTLISVWYGLSIATSVYVHYFGILLLPMHMIAFSLKSVARLSLIYFLVSCLVILFGVLPLVFYHPHSLHQIDWIQKPKFLDFFHTLRDLFGGNIIVMIFMGCFLLILINRNLQNLDYSKYFLLRVSLIWAITPICFVFLVSWLSKPIFVTRYFIWCLPGSAVLSCLILGYSSRNQYLKWMLFFSILFILISQSRVNLLRKSSGLSTAIQFLDEKIRPGESVVVYPYFQAMYVTELLDKIQSQKPFSRPIPITNLPYLPGGGGFDPKPDFELLKNIANQYNKIYIICRPNEKLNPIDYIRNRTWLVPIENVLLTRHPNRHDFIFGIGTIEPIRIIICE